MSSSIDPASSAGGVAVASGRVVENAEVAELLDKLADLLEIEGANRFRVRAYRTAARTVRDLPQSLAALVAEGTDLAELPGIGRDLAQKLVGVVESGHLPALEEARARAGGSGRPGRAARGRPEAGEGAVRRAWDHHAR